jgi:hypothetical protein
MMSVFTRFVSAFIGQHSSNAAWNPTAAKTAPSNINDAEEFALAAATTSDYSTVTDDPWFHCQRPGRLALVYRVIGRVPRGLTPWVNAVKMFDKFN